MSSLYNTAELTQLRITLLVIQSAEIITTILMKNTVLNYILNLDYTLNERNLNIFLNDFFNQLSKDTKYIGFITKVETDNKKHYSIDNKYIFNLSDDLDVANYISSVVTIFNDHFQINYDPKRIVKFIFSYQETTKDKDTNYNRKVNRFNNKLILFLVLYKE